MTTPLRGSWRSAGVWGERRNNAFSLAPVEPGACLRERPLEWATADDTPVRGNPAGVVRFGDDTRRTFPSGHHPPSESRCEKLKIRVRRARFVLDLS
jgi:hypothetical protein